MHLDERGVENSRLEWAAWMEGSEWVNGLGGSWGGSRGGSLDGVAACVGWAARRTDPWTESLCVLDVGRLVGWLVGRSHYVYWRRGWEKTKKEAVTEHKKEKKPEHIKSYVPGMSWG